MAQPAAGCLHGRDRDADHAAAGNGGAAVRGERQYDHRPGGAALSPHRQGRARPYRRPGPGGEETPRRGGRPSAPDKPVPGRIWQVGPVRYVPPSRAVADAVRGMDNLRDVRADRGRRRAAPRLPGTRASRGADRGPEHRIGPVPGGAGGRGGGDQVGNGGGSQGPAGQGAGFRCRCSTRRCSTADGTFIARPDAWWPELGIAIEVDSREWHLSPAGSRRTRSPAAGAWPVPDRGAQVHPQAATVRTRDGHRGNPPHARRRPRPPATEPPHRPGRSRQAEAGTGAEAGRRSRSRHGAEAEAEPKRVSRSENRRSGPAVPRW